MIVEWLVGIWSAFVEWLVSTLPTPAPPAFFGDVPAGIEAVAGYLSGTGVWFPFTLASVVLTAYAVCLLAAVAVKGVRIVASFFTAGGGSAA